MNAVAGPGYRRVLSRCAAALFGGYAFTWGFIALGITSCLRLGMDFNQAWTLMMMLAFVLFLTVVLWAFAARSLLRVWCVLAAGSAGMTLAATWLTQRLPGAG
jgi:hypothetical protein